MTYKVAVIMDDWKLPIFQKMMDKAEYKYSKEEVFCKGAFIIQVEIEKGNKVKFDHFVTKMNDKARRSKLNQETS